MSLDYLIYLEVNTSNGWKVPESLQRPSGYGMVAKPAFMINEKSQQARLFFRKGGLLEFNQGPPEGLDSNKHGLGPNLESQIWWQRVDELMIPSWKDLYFFLTTEVETRFARAFGTGNNPLPQSLIEEINENNGAPSYFHAGIGIITNSPIDWVNRRLNELYKKAPYMYVPVTYTINVRDFLGKEVMENIDRFPEFGCPQNLRLITQV